VSNEDFQPPIGDVDLYMAVLRTKRHEVVSLKIVPAKVKIIRHP
jgi:hypothetical protein